jgi:hypothetical protein
MIFLLDCICSMKLFLFCYTQSDNAPFMCHEKKTSSKRQHNHSITQQIMFMQFCGIPNYIPFYDY